MNSSTNSLNWFEIPALDIERARHFYQVIFSIHMDVMNMMDMEMAGFARQWQGFRSTGQKSLPYPFDGRHSCLFKRQPRNG